MTTQADAHPGIRHDGGTLTRGVVGMSAGAPVDVTELWLPAVAADQIRVRVAAAGVCHSDLSLVNGTLQPEFPVLLGHEASGVVAEVGSDVHGLAVGDHVVLNWAPACRQCAFCRRGESWLCARAATVLTAPSGELVDGTPLHAMAGLGALAEEVVIPADAAVRVADDLPLDLAAMLGCAVLTGTGAVLRTAKVQRGSVVAVVGLGGVGLSVVAGARLAEASKIIAIDVTREKEQLARLMGATDFVLADESLGKEVRRLTEIGADYVFECVGRAATIRRAWTLARRGGSCVVVGLGRPDDKVSFSAQELFYFARTLTSSVYGSSDPPADLPMLAGHVRDGRLNLAGLVTHRIGLADVPAAFERMERGIGGRSLVVM